MWKRLDENKNKKRGNDVDYDGENPSETRRAQY